MSLTVILSSRFTIKICGGFRGLHLFCFVFCHSAYACSFFAPLSHPGRYPALVSIYSTKLQCCVDWCLEVGRSRIAMETSLFLRSLLPLRYLPSNISIGS